MFQKVRKIAALALTVVLCGSIFAGCGNSGSGGSGDAGGETGGNDSSSSSDSGSGDQVTVKFVHKFPEEARMAFFEEVIKEFEDANPGIHIEMIAYGDEEIKDKTRVLLGSDDAPDIYFTWSGERITQYVDTGNTLDITSYLEEDSDWKDSFNETILETCKKNDAYWAIPWDYSSKEMVYNKAIFEEVGAEVPETWNELLDVCEKIKGAGYTPIAVGNQYPWVICHFLTTLNGKMVPKDTVDANYTMQEVAYTDPGYAQALDMMKELFDKGYINSDVNSCTWEMSQSMVYEGKAAMIYEEVQNLVNYDGTLGENLGYFDFPEVEGAAGEEHWITGGPDVFMVNSGSKHPDEAITFLKWITSDEVQSKMVYDLGFMPVTDAELDESKCLWATLEIIEKNLSAPGISEWLDCAINQTVADTYLIGCQTIFDGESGESIMANVSATAQEVADE